MKKFEEKGALAQLLLGKKLGEFRIDPNNREQILRSLHDALAVDPELKEAFDELIRTDSQFRLIYQRLVSRS